mgnify:CR=1 FL=1
MYQRTIFDNLISEPLAFRMRPKILDDFVGQKHLLGQGKLLRNLIENDKVSSMIFWGPPGVGKTTLARIIASHTKSEFIDFSAVTSGIKEIRKVMEEAERSRMMGIRTILFVDEIHRFNKAQQDAFLPFVERGSIILIGATTENPSFELNPALLSRTRVFILKNLSEEDIVSLLKRALTDDEELQKQNVQIEEDVLQVIASFSKGDARTALNTLEIIITNAEETDGRIIIKREDLDGVIQRKSLIYDKNGEEHFQVISALHESMRNSDVNASLYWLARMLEAGEDPLWIARRITRAAAEDVGLADTNALNVAVNAFQAAKLIGMPECNVHLAEAVIYICLAPKSNSTYLAYERAKEDAFAHDDLPIPMAVRGAYTKFQKSIGYGEGYIYPHDVPEKLTTMQCMPDELAGRIYYQPTEQGIEERIKKRYEYIENWKKEHRKDRTFTQSEGAGIDEKYHPWENRNTRRKGSQSEES